MLLVCIRIEDLKIIKGGAVSYSPTPTPKPNTTSCTGWAGQTFKHWDAGQSTKGSMASAGSQSEGYFRRVDGGRQPALLEVDGKLNNKRTERRQ